MKTSILLQQSGYSQVSIAATWPRFTPASVLKTLVTLDRAEFSKVQKSTLSMSEHAEILQASRMPTKF